MGTEYEKQYLQYFKIYQKKIHFVEHNLLVRPRYSEILLPPPCNHYWDIKSKYKSQGNKICKLFAVQRNFLEHPKN